ncbi:MAG: tyrosine-type recombinase/integrase [Propionicimonas sp.]
MSRARAALLPAEAPPVGLAGLLREEFRTDRIVLAAEDRALGWDGCLVAGCSRLAHSFGLCQGHYVRWVRAGRPVADQFVADTDPRVGTSRPNGCCKVDGCRYGLAGGGMCQLHRQAWRRAGQPEEEAWLASPAQIKTPPPGAVCAVPGCGLWPQAANPFCHAHYGTWRANGRPDPQQFVVRFTPDRVLASQVIDLSILPPGLRVEVAYGLQCRADQRSAKTIPDVAMRVVRFLSRSPQYSLLDLTEDRWRRAFTEQHGDRVAVALLAQLRRHVEDAADSTGWVGEYPRDVWRLRRLGFPGNQRLDLRPITQPWLATLGRRWLRWRIETGLGLEAVRRGLRTLVGLSGTCTDLAVTGIAGLDRAVLEAHLADLHAQFGGTACHSDRISQLSGFLQATREHHWEPALPANAVIYSSDYPPRTELHPRALDEYVMAQIEHPDNLDQWADPASRLVTMVLIRCGLRANDALRLPTDCIVYDSQGAPYLRYRNHKMRREALVPIDTDLHQLINAQVARIRAKHSTNAVLFPRPTKNPEGRFPLSLGTYRANLIKWLRRIQIHDRNGHPITVTPHQWRHTLGTRLINLDVPQEVVRRILDHDSPQMTAHYARLHDDTVRRHWEKAQAVNISGEPVTIDPDGPLAAASWARERIGRATQVLPNGCCALPVQQDCPHANACLTCPMFATTNHYLPQHRSHREQVNALIGAAQQAGQQRVVEMNQKVLANLDRIITSLETEAHRGS